MFVDLGQPYVRQSPRHIFARTAPEPDPHDALREATTQGTINSVRTIVDRLGPQPAPAPDIFAQTCAGLTQPEREQALALARHMLTALETLPPART